MADITRILADAAISIDAMLQKEPAAGETEADIIILTHKTQEKKAKQAITAIEALEAVSGQVARIRLESLG
jgi:homoserine dehydrogenase